MPKGIGVSEGYGIGTAVVLKENSLDYSAVTFTSAEEEKARLHDAVEQFKAETLKIADQLKKTAGEKEAEIMNGHIEMISDPYMVQQMEENIDGGCIAEAAVDTVCTMFHDMFAGSGDELLMQRASDVNDIRDGLLGILLGVHSVSIADAPAGSILIAGDFTPSMTGQINPENVAGIVAEIGGFTSHSAILARTMSVPAVLSVPEATSTIPDGATLILDGSAGTVIVDPDPETLEKYKKRQEEYLEEKEKLKKFLHEPTVTADGEKRAIYCNIGKPEDARMADASGCEGIGLFRTEFLFMGRDSEPSEDEQYEAYSSVAKVMGDREVIIRTLDIGGDKEIPYLSIEKEDNPFLGHRAIRYCLDNRTLFKRQLRALLRAGVDGNIKIMLPLITCVEEVEEAKKLLAECENELEQEGTAYRDVPVGIMVETPSAAILSDELAKVSAFFSIGTNDLTGYIMCADRGNPAVASLYDPTRPAVLRAIKQTIQNAKTAGIPVGMCGEAAADPRLIPDLLKWGLDEFSVSPSSVLRTRAVIAENPGK
ncbi:MAG: phosphoenolpyruvate--protein phosphotransferase [Acutalibacteraceae bacterium]|nr:phosphoenolpyruvate--protein phosphotransferase [Acutalibacteraceae bacterium]